MAFVRIIVLGAAVCATLGALSAAAQQTNAGECIIAGRITADEKWAPRMQGVQLLAPRGRVVTAAARQALADVEQVRLTQPALLSKCDGDGELAHAEDLPSSGPKQAVPAVSAGVVDVEKVSFPRLRNGSELVELKLRLPVDRVVMVKR
jgi:hypothetical protein